MIDTELEARVLGNAIMNPNAALELVDIIKTDEVFTSGLNKAYFKAICGLFSEGVDMDYLLTAKRAKKHISIAENEVLAYGMELISTVSGTSDQKYLCEALVDYYLKRSLRTVGGRIASASENSELDGLELALDGVQLLDDLINQNRLKDEQTLPQQVEETIEKVRQASKPGELVGLTTGLRDLDRVTGGMQPGHLVIIAGRPGMGKTALATCIAHANITREVPALFFTREMTDTEIIKRLVAMRSDLDMNDVFLRQLNADQLKYFEDEARKISSLPLVIDESSNDLTEVTYSIKRHVLRSGIKLVVIDYLQLLHGYSGKRYAGDTQVFTDITRKLKQVAKDYDIPIILLSQLNRDVENRPDKIPRLSDLKQSGSIEEDANMVLFCYRPEYYDMDYFPKANSEVVPQSALGMAEIRVAKNRSGQTGAVRTQYVGHKVLFKDSDGAKATSVNIQENDTSGLPF